MLKLNITYLIALAWEQLVQLLVGERPVSLKRVLLPVRGGRKATSRCGRHHRVPRQRSLHLASGGRLGWPLVPPGRRLS